MKTTPFQQIIRSEMLRLESIVQNDSRRIGGQVSLSLQSPHRSTKHKPFLLHLLKYRIGF